MSALSRWADEVQGKTADQAYVYYKQQDSKDRRTQENINSMVAKAFKNAAITLFNFGDCRIFLFLILFLLFFFKNRNSGFMVL